MNNKERRNIDVLLIEDDLATVRLLEAIFKMNGYSHKTAISGQGGLNELKESIPKVILLNIMLPDIDGYEVCKQIKRNNNLKHIPVFYETVIPEWIVKSKIEETGADGYILKPFDLSAITELLDSIIFSNRQQANNLPNNVVGNKLVQDHALVAAKKHYYPKVVSTAEKQINQYITLKLENGKTYIYVNGKRFIQCIRLILNIQKEDIPIYDEIESIDEAAKVYKNHIYQNRIVQGPMAAPVRNQSHNITPEQEFWGHCSNLQAWVENDYDTRILISNLSFPLLKELTRAGDPIAKRVYKEEIALRLESGYPSVVQYLLTQGYIKVFTPSEFKSILEATDIIKNLSSSPGVLNQFLRSCFHRFPTLIEDILLQILELQDGKNIIFSIIQKYHLIRFGNRLLFYLESLLSKIKKKKIRQDIFDCIKKIRSLKNERFCSAKISLFGDSDSGKEELVQKFTSKVFEEDIKMPFAPDFYVKDLKIDGKKVVIRFCDFGGKQRSKVLLSRFAKGSNGAIVIYDIANSETLKDLDYWVGFIRDKNGNIPIMLVGNILNLKAPRQVSKEEAIEVVIKYNLAMYLEISTSTGENVETMFEELTGLVMGKVRKQEEECQEIKKLKKKKKLEEFIYLTPIVFFFYPDLNEIIDTAIIYSVRITSPKKSGKSFKIHGVQEGNHRKRRLFKNHTINDVDFSRTLDRSDSLKMVCKLGVDKSSGKTIAQSY